VTTRSHYELHQATAGCMARYNPHEMVFVNITTGGATLVAIT